MFPQIPAIAGGGNPLMWVIYIMLVAVSLAVAKVITTLGQVACIEVWARFTERHRNGSSMVRKLIKRSSRRDLRRQPLFFRRHQADTAE